MASPHGRSGVRARDVNVLNTTQREFADIHFSDSAAPRVIERGRIDRHPYWRE
jgi:competence protein ComEC